MAALNVAIAAAAGAADLAQARRLIGEYFATSAADPDFSRCLAAQGAAAELAGLPGDYSPPRGRLLLARVGGEVAGCIALRPVPGDAAACEMKRLFVRPAFRGSGVARALVQALLREAAAAGYRQMVLDTLPTMAAAQALYRELGFEDLAASTSHPVAGARFMQRAL
ncbi:MAG TPA: GNAT family N-acetyltransferase [Planctomycetota bacterium]|nr:GNAT family N-acetyltransferase [Planctomycetota bacterium]